MNKLLILILATILLLVGSIAQARDTTHKFSISDVMEKPENSSQLNGISFFFGDQSHPTIRRSHGEFRTNKKTNAFNKSDLVACEWAMMSALLSLHKRAISLGADAVVNIKSNYKDHMVSSETEFNCGAGNIMAGVAFIGTVVEFE